MTTTCAFLFPGQGRLPDTFPAIPAALDGLVASMRNAGLPVDAWIEGDALDESVGTDVAQPMLLLDSLVREARLLSAGWQPDAVAGHSLGEYAALVSAGALGGQDAMRAVIHRSRLMQDVRGSMAAILKLDVATVSALCDGTRAVVANHNAAEQIVISGPQEDVEQVMARAEAEGARTIRLKVSGPFHSPMMEPAERALEPLLRSMTFSSARIPVVSGVSGRVERDSDTLRALLIRQITAPVHWVDVTATLEASGIDVAIEVGSGDVLTRLGRRSGAAIRFLTYEEALNERG